MSNNNFFITELGRVFEINYKETEKILNKLLKIIRKEKIITKNLLARVLIHNLKKIKEEEKIDSENLILTTFPHKCLEKFIKKFLELREEGWGAIRISNYFKDTLNCGISKSYLINVLKFLKENNQKIKIVNPNDNRPKDKNFFIEKLAQEFKISKKGLKQLLNRVSSQISQELKIEKNTNKTKLTKILIAKSIIQNLKQIKAKEEKAYKLLLLSHYKHKCLEKHYKIFLELQHKGWKAKRIANHFKNSLDCGISVSYINNILNFLKQIKKEEEKE